jgi:hypothetical protein
MFLIRHTTNGCMLKRNKYMVSKSSLLIMIWNGEKKWWNLLHL